MPTTPKKVSVNQRTTYPLNIVKGTTYHREFSWLPGGRAADLTGKIVRVHLKDVFPTKFELSSNANPTALGSFVQVSNVGLGKFILQLSSQDTATAKAGGKYWIEIIDGALIKTIWPPDTVVVKDL